MGAAAEAARGGVEGAGESESGGGGLGELGFGAVAEGEGGEEGGPVFRADGVVEEVVVEGAEDLAGGFDLGGGGAEVQGEVG